MIGDASVRDRFLMGCALFCMYSRSRWSDLSMVQFVELDSQEVDGEQFGFFESSTKYQKTATSALKKALEMPLVAPVMGCTNVEWCHIWVEIMLSLGVDMAAVPFGPICRAPNPLVVSMRGRLPLSRLPSS